MKKLYVASITPFDGNNQINDSTMRQLQDRDLAEGADGFFIGGSPGECFLLLREERVHTFELAGEYTDRTEMLTHVGAISTEEAIFYARKAKEMEIQNIATTPPFCFGFSDREIARYYYDIAEAVDMPVLYYGIPSSTHRESSPSQPDLAALLKSGAMEAIKHTSLSLYQMERIHDVNPDIRCYGGFENCMVAFLASGYDGFIGSDFSSMLPRYKKVMELCLSHHDDEVRILQSKPNCILGAVLKNGLYASLKYIVSCQGIQAGEVRKLMCPLTKNQETEVDQAVGIYIEVR